jgi:N12 class adenine-specific DNA methylase
MVSGNRVSLTETDLKAIFDQYAFKATGFEKDSDSTRGIHLVSRPSAGLKLWEDMTPAERKQELSEYILMDFETAQNEVESQNPSSYLLDRALDPLDPLNEVYKVILTKLGATIDGKTIKLPEAMQKSLEAENPKIQSTSLPRPTDTLRNGHTDDRGNYHITAEDEIGKGGKVAKFEANLAAIKLLKEIESEKRHATPEEQSVLVKYTGWGGLSEVFKRDLEGPWAARQQSLKWALTEQEYRSASRSTQNAHYTSPTAIEAIWTAVSRMGYSGGPTLEPATGIGHFFGMRPTNLPIEMHGVELDSISGRIAQQLYQSANIRLSGYEDLRMPADRYNLVISNVPFGDIKPYEEKKNQTPGLENRYSIHDFYFLKSLYGTRPGGMVAFITSRYTMDKQDSEVRSKIGEQADFVGAIRLPKNTFKEIADTEVVTDIVFLQKRPENEPMSDLTRAFIDTTEISLPCPDGTSKETAINKYFIDHPEMICGIQDLSGSMYAGNEYTVTLPQEELEKRLGAAVLSLPENIMSIMVDEKTDEMDISNSKALSHVDTESLPHGSFVIGQDNRLYQKDIETGQIALSPLYEHERENRLDISRIMQLCSIRDAVKQAIDHYYSGQQLECKSDIKNLNSLYDLFVKDHGFLNVKKNYSLFSDDPDSSLLHSLENWDAKTKTATKADIFKGISFAKKEPVTWVDSPVDAMVLSLSRYGNLNLAYMESLTGNDREQIVSSLLSSGHLYRDPHEYLSHGRTAYITSDEYLSGNIRIKLAEARAAAEKDPLVFGRNVSSLEVVMPKDLGPQDISIRINSPIVGEKHVSEFVKELVDAYNVEVLHLSINGKWEIKCRSWSALNTETFGTHDMNAVEIINNMMNGKPLKVYDKLPDDRLVLNQERTAAVEAKADAINNAFNQWIWKDPERTEDIVRRYNDVYNSCVERKFIHPERLINPNAKIFLHGCNFPFPLRSNQADAVWRVIQEPNTMLAHSVGAGKSLEMACSAMELRRLGLRSKPMIVCPDHMIGQWAAEFRQAYPAAKLLIADDQNWDKENRRTFINKIATGDWDTIIIRSESFKMIPMSAEYQQRFFEQKIAEYSAILDATDSAHKKSRSVKELEKAIEKYEDKIKELADAHHDEGVIPFDKLGVDHLFIDEADIFKNLEYYTQLQNVRGLGTPKGSERALDMLMKVRHVQENDGGITFATGTPISNTLVEAYTMQRFLQPEVLKANGLQAFDEWARQYAETVTQMELNNTGTGYTPVTRFSKIVNVPELITSLRQTWDIQTAHNLEQNGILVPGINLPNMKIINEAAPATPLLQAYLKHLEDRESNLKGRAEKGADNVLSIMTDGRKAAVDMRLINPYLPDDPNSKLNLGARIIHGVYERYKSEGYTCAVFFDKSCSFDRAGNLRFDGIAEMKSKLIEFGVKPDEIGDVRSCKTFDERRRLFEQVREGNKRIIFGTTGLMGAGTNFQDKLKAIVHVDAPWRPRDIEQQNGRGYRSGNKTGELEVYNLVTKGSLDTGLWNVLETKANSIRQVMDGSDKNTRQIDEDYYGSVKELSIDNALMKEAVDLDHSLRKLKAQERAFSNEVAHAHRMLKTVPADIKRSQEEIENIQKAIASRHPEAKSDDFKITLEGKIHTERKEAGTALKASANTLFLQSKASGNNIEKQIGEYSGFKITLRTTLQESSTIARINIITSKFNYHVDLRPDSDPVALCKGIHSQVYKGPEKTIEQIQSELTKKQQNLIEFEKIAASTFPKAEELRIKDARYTEVMAQLRKEAENKSPEQKNPHDINWAALPTMTPSEVQNAVAAFLENCPSQSPHGLADGSKNILTVEDLTKSLSEQHNLHLPPKLVCQIDGHIQSGKINASITHDLITAAVAEFGTKGYCWRKIEDHDNTLIYSRDHSNPRSGDIVVKSSPNGTDYEAYRIVDAKTLKLLGADSSLEAIQSRAESFAIFSLIKSCVNETAELANRVVPIVKEPSQSFGIDL